VAHFLTLLHRPTAAKPDAAYCRGKGSVYRLDGVASLGKVRILALSRRCARLGDKMWIQEVDNAKFQISYSDRKK